MDINSSSNSSVEINGTGFSDPELNTWKRILVGSTMSPIIVFGAIGNVLSLLVWVKVRRCQNSTACFLAALAASDLLALLTAGLNFWMSNVLEKDLRNFGSFPCKFLVYVDFSAQFSSAWIIVLVTVERTVALWLPHKYKMSCRPALSRVIIAFAVIAILFMCLPFILSADIVTVSSNITSTKQVCMFTEESTLVKDEILWFYVEMIIHFVLPFILISVSNSSVMLKTAFLAVNRRRSAGNIGGRPRGSDRKMLKNVSVRIIVLSIAFCLGVGPIHIYGYKESLQVEQLKNSASSNRLNKEADPLYMSFVVLMYLNNAVNFFLYCFIGSGFRKDLMKLFRKRSSFYLAVTV